MGTKIDLIIPAYKATKTIGQALASVAIQNIVKDIKVTVIVDGDGLNEKYFEIARSFKDLLDLRIQCLKENKGVGFARQYGIDTTSNPYIAFLDADDTLSGAFAVEMLREKLESRQGLKEGAQNVVSIGMFFEKRKEMSFVKHENDTVWVHGKLYRRSFLDKYDIRFLTSSANEDAGFNAKVRLLETENERIAFLPNLVYYWQWNDDGITRVNNFEYTYDKSFVGYALNMIDAVNHTKKYFPNEVYIDDYAINCMAVLYTYYIRAIHFRPDLEQQCLEYSKKYYEETILRFDLFNKYDRQHLDDVISQVITVQSAHFNGIVAHVTFWDFIDTIK